MGYLIFVLATFAFLVGFFVLTNYEKRHGARFCEKQRARLDHSVERIIFVSEHVNFSEFLRDEMRHFVGHIGHSVVHFSLIGTRVVERVLTNLVRRLRTHPEIDTAPRETAREFVKTLSEFKDGLNATHPEISDIK